MKITEIFETVTKPELDNVENKLDAIFGKHGIDIDFSKHFLDRVNDPRNVTPITIEELEKIYTEVEKRFGKKLAMEPVSYQALMQDLSTALNIPIVMASKLNSNHKSILAKTVMRKSNFYPNIKDDILQVGLNPKKVRR